MDRGRAPDGIGHLMILSHTRLIEINESEVMISPGTGNKINSTRTCISVCQTSYFFLLLVNGHPDH